MVERLGIVYTPVELVDFIIRSVDDILKQEFNRSLTDENIHILDPFTGTGTFITRLLQSGLIDVNDLDRKYKHEIHANEIVLLAYYIASVNIENAYHDATPDPDDGIGKEKYVPYDGIVLTDTFQMGETDYGESLFSEMFPKNSVRVDRQKNAPVRIILGNPPYSIGQKSANDNAQNQTYLKLDQRIADTYAARSSAGLNKSLYDAYIKAFRWSSDRLGPDGGIICYVTNGAWLDGNSTDGFRLAIEEEFDKIYVFNLRGNQRTSGELSRREGGKIFGSGSRTPIAITLLVKKPGGQKKKAEIFYHDIGDYFSREEKLQIVRKFTSFKKMSLKPIRPNEHGDWTNKRNDAFETYIPLAPEKKYDKTTQSVFITSSLGLGTNRDAWCYNSSKEQLKNNILNSILFYNQHRTTFHENISTDVGRISVKDFIKYDSTKINWTDSVIRDLEKNTEYIFNSESMTVGFYRPFYKQNLYFSKELNHRTYQQQNLFPLRSIKNIVISLCGTGVNKDFTLLITKYIPDLQLIANGQCFPLYFYEENNVYQKSLFDDFGDEPYIRRDAISDFILDRARKQYGKNVGKEDIFYYVYGFLHSPEYRETFANDLKKMLPRLPLIDDVRHFWAFSKAGRKLAELHLNYEEVEAHPDVLVSGDDGAFYTVEKMRFPSKDRKDTILYNSRISVSNIPEKAYQYIVNGKSAIEWIMERYQVTTHKDSGITNDPNDWAAEHDQPRYILDLLLSVIHVSTQTVDIVDGLPKLDFSGDEEYSAEDVRSGMAAEGE